MTTNKQYYSSCMFSPIVIAVVMYLFSLYRDQNMGLVKQCLNALYKKNIQRLTRTFLTLSLADVANRVQLSSPQEAQKYILHMVCCSFSVVFKDEIIKWRLKTMWGILTFPVISSSLFIVIVMAYLAFVHDCLLYSVSCWITMYASHFTFTLFIV